MGKFKFSDETLEHIFSNTGRKDGTAEQAVCAGNKNRLKHLRGLFSPFYVGGG